ncbi:hypothetical protein L226DRAFT_613740 [Lentinus tigrinus ALCF2SS1-7]|uniref:Uncharacterized protein n=1 Tax=Lentinus tigrinus ALCF2SS1-6 TaxID=1328759 RepID=A0A5C2RYL8_9APHY|nr:hypothetical protein L227DRAFT_656455 [Lentinus tigrinus ALCF2SS1-6]RPD73956.1 hypothetical protein L226DRAFT_613740 [Lentinus tigrinus ALCF2SS1-7]
MTYTKYARYTFETPEGQCFLASKATIRKEYERWLAAELRRTRARKAVKPERTTRSTTRDHAEERGRSRTRTTATKSVGDGKVAKRKMLEAALAAEKHAAEKVQVDESNARKTTPVYETHQLRTKRKATSAVDDERPAKKLKTRHVISILKVSPAKGQKHVRWCTSVQEPRVTVRPKIVRISCPDPTPETSVVAARPLEFEDLSGAARPKKPMVERWSRTLPLPPWNCRHALYHELKKMDYGLDQWIETMAKRGSSTAQLLLAPHAA